MNNKTDLSIIIVNYNVKDLIDNCLESIYRNCGNLAVEIIVTDNNSTDRSVEFIRKKYPKVTLITSKENLGFARGTNVGLSRSKGDFVLLLNPDTILFPNTLPYMINFLKSHKEAGAVGCKEIGAEGESKRYGSPQHMPRIWTEPFEAFGLSYRFPDNRIFGFQKMGYWHHNRLSKVEVLGGFCLMIKREVIEKIGFMDEEFWMYGDDYDYCNRIREAGYHLYYLPRCQVIHLGQKSAQRNLKDDLQLAAWRSKYHLFAKVYGINHVRILNLILIFSATLRYLKLLLRTSSSENERHRVREILRWHLGGSGLVPAILK